MPWRVSHDQHHRYMLQHGFRDFARMIHCTSLAAIHLGYFSTLIREMRRCGSGLEDCPMPTAFTSVTCVMRMKPGWQTSRVVRANHAHVLPNGADLTFHCWKRSTPLSNDLVLQHQQIYLTNPLWACRCVLYQSARNVLPMSPRRLAMGPRFLWGKSRGSLLELRGTKLA